LTEVTTAKDVERGKEERDKDEKKKEKRERQRKRESKSVCRSRDSDGIPKLESAQEALCLESNPGPWEVELAGCGSPTPF
jgi:hypothetical protein